MEFTPGKQIVQLSNPGVISRQLLNPNNSTSQRVTITEVHLRPGAIQPRHQHEASEQIWYAMQGTGKLMLAENTEKEFSAGDIGDTEFIYLSITSPPVDFGYAYQDKKQ